MIDDQGVYNPLVISSTDTSLVCTKGMMIVKLVPSPSLDAISIRPFIRVYTH